MCVYVYIIYIHISSMIYKDIYRTLTYSTKLGKAA